MILWIGKLVDMERSLTPRLDAGTSKGLDLFGPPRLDLGWNCGLGMLESLWAIISNLKQIPTSGPRRWPVIEKIARPMFADVTDRTSLARKTEHNLSVHQAKSRDSSMAVMPTINEISVMVVTIGHQPWWEDQVPRPLKHEATSHCRRAKNDWSSAMAAGVDLATWGGLGWGWAEFDLGWILP